MRGTATFGIGLGMAGAGAVLMFLALLLEDGYWLLLTGTVLLIIGLVIAASAALARARDG